MGYIKSFLYEFKNTYTVDDRLITIVFASLFLPWPITIVTLLLAALYLMVKSDLLETIRRIPSAKIAMILPIYLLIISLLNENWLGAIISVFMFFVFSITLHYRRYIHKDLFSQLLDIAIILSIVSVGVAILEQFYYMSIIDGMGFLDIQNKPMYRVHTFFFNANYYAMMIMFVECICVYKFFMIKEIKWRFYYTLMGVLNLFSLFLTGGRTAWLCIGIALVVMLLVNRWYKLLAATLIAGCGAVGVLALKPGLLPRLAARGLAIERRQQIWQTAILMIQDNWLFGQGPLTYFHAYSGYKAEYIATYGLESFKHYKLGISSQHSHTIFLEPIVSFGIIGSLMMLVYLVSQAKYVLLLAIKKIDITLAALLIGVAVGTFLFCVIDFPIYWVQTGPLFFLLMGSCDMYKKELKQ